LRTALTVTERKRNQRELGKMRREKAKMKKQKQRGEQAEARCVCQCVCMFLNMLTKLCIWYCVSSKLSDGYFGHSRYLHIG
jgi:hypothetical protein